MRRSTLKLAPPPDLSEVGLVSAKRVFLRRVFDDGTVEEYDLEFDGSRIYGAPPPVDTSVIGRRWSEEYIIEWDEAGRSAPNPSG